MTVHKGDRYVIYIYIND